MSSRKHSWWVHIALAVLGVLSAPRAAYSQGCALCYTQAASAGERMIASLRSGILILIAPPMLMTIGVAIVAYRRRNHCAQDEGREPAVRDNPIDEE